MPESNYKFSGNVLEHYDRDTGAPSTALDWVRAVKSKKNIRVNGKLLYEYPALQALMEYPPSLSDQDKEVVNAILQKFFKEEVLKEMQGSDTEKEAAVNYLMKNFHQGGLLRVFTLSASHHISQKTNYSMSIGELDVKWMNFIATPQGFDINESGLIKKATRGAERIEPTAGVLDVKESKISVNFNERIDAETTNEIEPTIKHNKCDIELLDNGIANSFLEYDIITEAGPKQNLPKWQKFHSDNSPVKVEKDGTVMMKEAFVKQWQQAVADDLIYVNNQSLQQLEGRFNTFEEIAQFCKEVLLKNYADDATKEAAFTKLMAHLMREDALAPVSAGVKALLAEKFELAEVALTPERQIARQTYDITTPIESDVAMKHQVHLVSTPTGIDMQEKVQVTAMKVKKGGRAENIELTGGKNHLLKCQATMSLDISNDEPSMTVNSNTISYGSEEVAKVVDTRSITKKIMDYLGRIFGYHQITDITHPDQSADIDAPGP